MQEPESFRFPQQQPSQQPPQQPPHTSQEGGAQEPVQQPLRRERLFEDARMRRPRIMRLLWRALYEIWRLSWYCGPAATGGTAARLHPCFVRLGDWLAAVRVDYKRGDAEAQRPACKVDITAQELLSIAGAQIKMRMVTTRWWPQDNTLRYAITPWAGSCVQLFLNHQDVPQALRPGVPAATDHLHACSQSVVRDLGVWLHISPQVRTYHAQWVSGVIQNTVQQADPVRNGFVCPPQQQQQQQPRQAALALDDPEEQEEKADLFAL